MSDTPGVLKYLDGLVGDLRGRLPAALTEFGEEDVHQARVATRRLSSAVEEAGGLGVVIGRKPLKAFRKVLRKVRRVLGQHRDLDVLAGHLAGMEGQPGVGRLA